VNLAEVYPRSKYRFKIVAKLGRIWILVLFEFIILKYGNVTVLRETWGFLGNNENEELLKSAKLVSKSRNMNCY